MPSPGACHTHHILVHLSVFPFFFFPSFFYFYFFLSLSLNRLCSDLETNVWKYYRPFIAYFNVYMMGGGYLNFRAQFMKNVLFKQEKIKLRNKRHFVKNKTENNASCLVKML